MARGRNGGIRRRIDRRKRRKNRDGDPQNNGNDNPQNNRNDSLNNPEEDPQNNNEQAPRNNSAENPTVCEDNRSKCAVDPKLNGTDDTQNNNQGPLPQNNNEQDPRSNSEENPPNSPRVEEIVPSAITEERFNQLFEKVCSFKNEPDLWNSERIKAILKFHIALRESMRAAVFNERTSFSQDWITKRMEKAISRLSSPIVCAVSAKIALGGVMAFKYRNLDRSYTLYEDALELCKEATPLQRSIVLNYRVPISVDTVLNCQRRHVERIIANFKNNAYLRMEGDEVVEIPVVAGYVCDGCGKHRQMDEKRYFTCDRCKLAHFCSNDCLKHAWQQGHRNTCRKKGEIKVGDIMKICCDLGDLDCGQAVKIVAPEVPGSKCTDKWVVSANHGHEIEDNVFLVDSKDLRRVRAALWNVYARRTDGVEESVRDYFIP